MSAEIIPSPRDEDVAISRILLDMHWLSDVVGGFTLGAAYLLLAIWLSQRLPEPCPAAVEVLDASNSVATVR